ncbi:hypothetical protein EV363DRAFT_1175975, partial [Boletus edulis]
VPRLGPRRCLDCASTCPRLPPPPPAIACTPSPRPTCTDTIMRLLTCMARLSFTLARHRDRSHRLSDVHGPHAPHRPTSCAPHPCPPVLARTLLRSQQRCGNDDDVTIVTARSPRCRRDHLPACAPSTRPTCTNIIRAQSTPALLPVHSPCTVVGPRLT